MLLLHSFKELYYASAAFMINDSGNQSACVTRRVKHQLREREQNRDWNGFKRGGINKNCK